MAAMPIPPSISCTIAEVVNVFSGVKLALKIPEPNPSRITSYNVCYTKLLRYSIFVEFLR